MTPSNFEDLTGCKFGRLTVIQRAKSAKGWRTKWLCRCDCGKEVIVDRGNLKSGHTLQSCVHESPKNEPTEDGEMNHILTGSAVKGAHIDLCVESHEAAIQAGVRSATIFWCEE